MKSLVPASTAPTGQPSPLVRSIHMESQGAAKARAAIPLPTTAFMNRAPSMWSASLCFAATAETFWMVSSGQIVPPPPMLVCSIEIMRERG